MGTTLILRKLHQVSSINIFYANFFPSKNNRINSIVIENSKITKQHFLERFRIEQGASIICSGHSNKRSCSSPSNFTRDFLHLKEEDFKEKKWPIFNKCPSWINQSGEPAAWISQWGGRCHCSSQWNKTFTSKCPSFLWGFNSTG